MENNLAQTNASKSIEVPRWFLQQIVKEKENISVVLADPILEEKQTKSKIVKKFLRNKITIKRAVLWTLLVVVNIWTYRLDSTIPDSLTNLLHVMSWGAVLTDLGVLYIVYDEVKKLRSDLASNLSLWSTSWSRLKLSEMEDIWGTTDPISSEIINFREDWFVYKIVKDENGKDNFIYYAKDILDSWLCTKVWKVWSVSAAEVNRRLEALKK